MISTFGEVALRNAVAPNGSFLAVEWSAVAVASLMAGYGKSCVAMIIDN